MSALIGYVAADVDGIEPGTLVDGLSGLGYRAIDWTMEQFDPFEQDPQALVDLVELAQAAGLAVPQLMVHQDYVARDPAVWEERVVRTERSIEASAAAGIPTVGVVTGPNRWIDGCSVPGEHLSEEEAWDLSVRALDRVVGHADGTGVAVALEPCWGTLAWNAETTDLLLDQLGSDAITLNLDPSHFAISGDDVAQLVHRWSERIAHVHLKDAFGVPGTEGEDFCFLLPGEGSTDWPAFLEALDAAGYQGSMSVEFESFRLREQALGDDIMAGAELALGLVNGILGRAAHA